MARASMPTVVQPPQYAQVFLGTKTSFKQPMQTFFFSPLFNTNSVQIKIELIAQAHREKGRAEGVIWKLLENGANKIHKIHKFEDN